MSINSYFLAENYKAKIHKKNKKRRNKKKEEIIKGRKSDKKINKNHKASNLINLPKFKGLFNEYFRFLLFNEKSFLNFDKLLTPKNYGKRVYINIPQNFSIITNSNESYSVLKTLLPALLGTECEEIIVDYKKTDHIGLSTQVLFDIILFNSLIFLDSPNAHKKINIKGINFNNEIKKFLLSVGSASHINSEITFEDVEKYPLCVYKKNDLSYNEIHTTELVDYVINSLAKIGRKLTKKRIDNLSTVIGEILINAEEHSTTNHRFSVGFFKSNENSGKFRLSILNLGETIYEKFKDPNCRRPEIVEKMKTLSVKYKSGSIFSRSFDEGVLWTLYALQEGVTSTDPKEYKKRGNGSIRFIESFFDIKGKKDKKDQFSKMYIISGNTCIEFDGTYEIMEKNDQSENKKSDFKVMTFNKSGNLEEKPDSKYVKKIGAYFPGTLIEAEILFDQDDLE